MKTQKCLGQALLAAFLLPAFATCQTFPCGTPSPPPGTGFSLENINVATSGVVQNREYLLHIPNHTPADTLAIVLAFHGGGQNAEMMATHWQEQQNDNMIIICPQALSANGCRWHFANIHHPAYPDDDLDFVEELLDQWTDPAFLSAQNITAFVLEQAYATGFSSGAGFTWQLANHVAFVDRFNGFAPAAKSFDQFTVSGGGGSWAALPPKPVIYAYGTGDTNLRELWNTLGGSYRFAPLPVENMKGWLGRNRLDLSALMVNTYVDIVDRPQLGAVIQLFPADFLGDAKAFQFITIVNGGHFYPSPHVAKASEHYLASLGLPERIVDFWREYAGLPQ